MSEESEPTWEITVVTENEKKRKVRVPKNCEVFSLIEKIAEILDMDPDYVNLTYVDKHLSLDEEFRNKKLSDYDLRDNSLVIMVLKLPGGIWRIDVLKEKKVTLEPLEGFITVTTLESEPDMISLDDDTTSKRAKMPCGHVIGPSSMTSYCESLLSEGKYIFTCPHVDELTGARCGVEWPFFLVRHVACLSEAELECVEKKTTENALKKGNGIQQCPGCNNWCFRNEPTNRCVHCPVCSRKQGAAYDFCWECLGEWLDPFSNTKCGNSGCIELDRRLAILSTCPEKLIESTKAPSVRGCAKCGVLIEHESACKHMDCKCGYSFCFFCLEPKSVEKGWQCEAYSGDCHIAPRQKSLPSVRNASGISNPFQAI